MAVNLWADLLVLQARFEERKNVCPEEPDSADALKSVVWSEAYNLLSEVIKKHTR
jgi:hypothetical protein